MLRSPHHLWAESARFLEFTVLTPTLLLLSWSRPSQNSPCCIVTASLVLGKHYIYCKVTSVLSGVSKWARQEADWTLSQRSRHRDKKFVSTTTKENGSSPNAVMISVYFWWGEPWRLASLHNVVPRILQQSPNKDKSIHRKIIAAHACVVTCYMQGNQGTIIYIYYILYKGI